MKNTPCPLPYPRLYTDLPLHHQQVALECQILQSHVLSPSIKEQYITFRLQSPKWSKLGPVDQRCDYDKLKDHIPNTLIPL